VEQVIGDVSAGVAARQLEGLEDEGALFDSLVKKLEDEFDD